MVDEIIERAARAIYEHSTYRQWVGDETHLPDGPAWDFARAALTAAAPLLVAAERERCARIAEARDLSIMSSTAVDIEARKIAAAIREGKNV